MADIIAGISVNSWAVSTVLMIPSTECGSVEPAGIILMSGMKDYDSTITARELIVLI